MAIKRSYSALSGAKMALTLAGTCGYFSTLLRRIRAFHQKDAQYIQDAKEDDLLT